MASFDGLLTTRAEFDEFYKPFCGLCDSDKIRNEAKHYCLNCEKNLCDACRDSHRMTPILKDHKVLHGQTKPINDRQNSEVTIKSQLKIASSRLLYIKEEDDRSDPSIVGCGFMQSGFVLLSDNANRKLKLLDTTLGIITDNLQLDVRPCDLSVKDESNAVVAVSFKEQLLFVQVFPRLKISQKVNIHKRCFGVEVYESEIYVSCHNRPGDGEVRIYNFEGNMIRRLGVSNGEFQFVGPHYLTIGKAGKCKRIYVSDWDKSVVTCMTTNGHTIYQYTDTTLKEPEAIVVDSSGSVFVCNSGANTVEIITADGSKGSVLLSKSDCLSQPLSVAFREGDGTLIVGCYLQKNLMYFKLADI